MGRGADSPGGQRAARAADGQRAADGAGGPGESSADGPGAAGDIAGRMLSLGRIDPADGHLLRGRLVLYRDGVMRLVYDSVDEDKLRAMGLSREAIKELNANVRLNVYKKHRGRAVTPREQLTRDFVIALSNDFAKFGVQAIEVVRENRPDAYLKLIASLVPREVDINGNTFVDQTLAEYTEDQLLAVLKHLDNVVDVDPAAGRQEPAAEPSSGQALAATPARLANPALVLRAAIASTATAEDLRAASELNAQDEPDGDDEE